MREKREKGRARERERERVQALTHLVSVGSPAASIATMPLRMSYPESTIRAFFLD